MKILVIYKQNEKFVRDDIKILKSHYDVTVFQYKNIKSIYQIWKLAKEMDIIYIWFAGLHAFFTTLLTRKPKIVVTGGYDVASAKEFKYGLLNSRILKMMVKYILKKAKVILSVSQYNKEEIINNLNNKSSIMLYNGIDTDVFKPKDDKLENFVLTVGTVNKKNLTRKGLDKFVNLALTSNIMNDGLKFIVVGNIDPKLLDYVLKLEKTIPNLKFSGYLSDEDLLELYQLARVYCQLSQYESFGMAVIEAMACNCVPLVSDKGALPEVVGDVGYIVPYGNNHEIYSSLMKIINEPLNKNIRQRVIDKFNIKFREDALIKVIDNVNKYYN